MPGEVPGEGLLERLALGGEPAPSSAASAFGSVCPPTSAAIICRPETPKMSLATTLSLIWASSSSFSTRCFSAVRTPTRSARYRVTSRNRRISGGGTKLGRIISPLGDLAQPHRIQLVRLRPSRAGASRHGRSPATPPALGPPADKTPASRSLRWPPSPPGSPPDSADDPTSPAASASSWSRSPPPATAALACPHAAPAHNRPAPPCRYPAPLPAR